MGLLQVSCLRFRAVSGFSFRNLYTLNCCRFLDWGWGIWSGSDAGILQYMEPFPGKGAERLCADLEPARSPLCRGDGSGRDL